MPAMPGGTWIGIRYSAAPLSVTRKLPGVEPATLCAWRTDGLVLSAPSTNSVLAMDMAAKVSRGAPHRPTNCGDISKSDEQGDRRGGQAGGEGPGDDGFHPQPDDLGAALGAHGAE